MKVYKYKNKYALIVSNAERDSLRALIDLAIPYAQEGGLCFLRDVKRLGQAIFLPTTPMEIESIKFRRAKK